MVINRDASGASIPHFSPDSPVKAAQRYDIYLYRNTFFARTQDAGPGFPKQGGPAGWGQTERPGRSAAQNPTPHPRPRPPKNYERPEVVFVYVHINRAMNYRSVANILPAQAMEMGPITIHQPLPTQRVEQIDPFLLLHHFGPWTVDPGHDPLDLGPHPHRGFEPVTFLYNGGLRHRDSRGNTGILEAGDVQWMTAGMGIIHSERGNKNFLENGGTLEGIQLWVNLAPEHKFVQPRYQDMKAASFPCHDFGNGAVLKVVAGEFNGQRGPAKTYSPLIAWQLELPAGARAELPVPEDHNFAAYLLDGKVKTSNGFSHEGRVLLNYKRDGDGIALTGEAEMTRILLLGGTPLGAPVAQHGPFVMNTQTEILEAMRDYQMGKMGFYVEG